MTLYDQFLKAAADNLDAANEAAKTNGPGANYLIQFAQTQALLAIAEAIRNPKPTPHNLPPL